jgi:hypothetical protein
MDMIRHMMKRDNGAEIHGWLWMRMRNGKREYAVTISSTDAAPAEDQFRFSSEEAARDYFHAS